MKKVNFDPELELKKIKIMAEFDENNGPKVADPISVDVHEPPNSAQNGGIDNADQPVGELKDQVIDALKTVYDPEIPVNIFDLGLIYDVRIDNGFVDVDMTLTAPGCPVAHTFPGMVERAICLVPGVNGAAVEIVWDPPWTPELISEAARLELGLI